MLRTGQPIPTVPELEYSVRNGISGMRLTKPLATIVEADAAAIRLIVCISWKFGIVIG